MKKLRIGVIYGGRSGEHEVSVASAAAVVQHLDKDRYEPIPIRIEKSGRWRGRYFVLGGLVSPLEGTGSASLPLERLLARCR